jgi:omega-hydroxy-beta-dihydromenaquinone-9 sulfotransferase
MKPRWGFWNNYLVGIPWERWRALTAENRVEPGYCHRAAFLTAMSLRNSILRRREERRYGAAIAKTNIEDRPLFVLGHWRGGTTHLHNLLACDTEQFATPNSTQTTYPYSFLCTEDAVKRRFAGWLPPTRPMDNVEIGLDTPQEDEFAMCVTCLRSPYLGISTFPQRAGHYDRYLTFREAPRYELEEWKAAFLWFLRKLTLKYQRPLLLKSPTHTARIRLLLDLFPGARFVHIHRHPHAVFQSTRHLLQRLWPINALQEPPPGVEDEILRRYTRMYDAFFEERKLIPEGRYHEIAFDELAGDPIGQVAAVYERLSLPGFEKLRPRLREYVASVSGYRRNEFPELPPALRERVTQAWQRSFEAWGYAV